MGKLHLSCGCVVDDEIKSFFRRCDRLRARRRMLKKHPQIYAVRREQHILRGLGIADL